jgi:hypothetical protein
MLNSENSEYEIINNSETLIVSFGGRLLKFGMILPYEFLNFLNKHFVNVDKLFYIDKDQMNYHKGIYGITRNIDETLLYLGEKIKNYKKVVFMGVSAGGYAALLFGSLLNVTTIIAFIPQTILRKPYDEKYGNLKKYINNVTKYYLFGDLSVKDVNDPHHINHCEHISIFPNVTLFKKSKISLPEMRDSGELYVILNALI